MVTPIRSYRSYLNCSGLWGVLNNAGSRSRIGSPDWLTVDDYKKQCDVNLFGGIDVTLTFLPLVKKEKGRIVNTSSAMGRTALAFGLTYAVSKYGVEAFTDGIRYDIANNVDTANEIGYLY